MNGSEGLVRRFAAPRESNSLSHPGDSAHVVWRKSSWSTWNGNCVEVAALPAGAVAVRDTKARGHGPVLVFGAGTWAEFLSRIKNSDPIL